MSVLDSGLNEGILYEFRVVEDEFSERDTTCVFAMECFVFNSGECCVEERGADDIFDEFLIFLGVAVFNNPVDQGALEVLFTEPALE